MQNKESPQ